MKGRLTSTEIAQAPPFEDVLGRSHQRLLSKMLLALSVLCALVVTAGAVGEQTRWGSHSFLAEVRSSADQLRVVLKGARRDTVDAVLAHTARDGVPVPLLRIGGMARGETDSVMEAFGMQFAYLQSFPKGYLQWIEDGRRYSVGPMRQIGVVPEHWRQALMTAPEAGVVLEEPASSPLQDMRFAKAQLDTLLVPIEPGRAVAIMLPRKWMGIGDIITSAGVTFVVVWLGSLILFGLPAFALGYSQVRREARAVARPLERLTSAAEALRRGRTVPDLPLEGAQELRQLAAAFNDMGSSLTKARAQIEASRDKLQHTLDQQRELFANISHDLRTPLSAVAGYAEILERDHPDLRAAAVIHREAASMARLVDDIFELARLEDATLTLNMRQVLVRDVLTHVQHTYVKQAWDRGVLLNLVECSPPLRSIKVMADSQRLTQILGNLVSNAIRHTPPGGYIELGFASAGDRIRVLVSDSGTGIAADDLPHVFERSFRGDRARRDGADHRHAGLGLAIARGLARAMGADLQVESTGKQGTVFALLLRCASDAQPGNAA